MVPTTADESAPRIGVVVPLRSFRDAKGRLRDALDTPARIELMQHCARRVLESAGHHFRAVVTSDDAVAKFARQQGAAVIDDPGSLDGAAAAGVRWAESIDCERVVVVHADLPFATTLAALTAPGRASVAVIVPDHRNDGTPALSIPTNSAFRFAYGTGSFERHCAAAVSANLELEIVRDGDLGFDIDLPADLDVMMKRMHA
jgi:2-phospho-L-lactate guanylyltransferase